MLSVKRSQWLGRFLPLVQTGLIDWDISSTELFPLFSVNGSGWTGMFTLSANEDFDDSLI